MNGHNEPIRYIATLHKVKKNTPFRLGNAGSITNKTHLWIVYGSSFRSLVDPYPCFAEKRLDVVENKGLTLTNAEKRACIALKTLRWLLEQRSKEDPNCSEDVAVARGRSWTMVAGGGQDVRGTEFWEE